MDGSINSYTTTDILINERIFETPFQDFKQAATTTISMANGSKREAKNDFSAKRKNFQHSFYTHIRTHTHTHTHT